MDKFDLGFTAIMAGITAVISVIVAIYNGYDAKMAHNDRDNMAARLAIVEEQLKAAQSRNAYLESQLQTKLSEAVITRNTITQAVKLLQTDT